MNIESIAQVTHELNAAYCRAIGDNSQKPWKDAPHPCIVPFDELPLDQQIKDRLFRQTVHALAPLLRIE